jgi:hypothetical protein
MQNLDGENISCIDGSRSCGTTLFGGGAMAERQGGNLVPVAGEVRHRSSYLKKLKKLPNKYRTSYKYHAIY